MRPSTPCLDRDPARAIPAAEVFALYERNWRHIDTKALAESERRLIADLPSRFGGGILMPCRAERTCIERLRFHPTDARSASGLFDEPINQPRDVRCDRYGLAMMIEADGAPIKLEIVREARISLDGAFDPSLGCPRLSLDVPFAETLLANSDRGKDPSGSYRDAIHLGMPILNQGGSLSEARASKAFAAYGQDVRRDARWVVDHSRRRPRELERAADALRMAAALARAAMKAFAKSIPSPSSSPA